MVRLPDSPRARRRLFRGSILGALVLVVAFVVVLIPNHKPANTEATGREGSAQLAAATPRLHVSTADRRQINEVLDRFLPGALTRTSPDATWALAGPEIRAATTLAGWRAGTTPVPNYPVRETTFHTWRIIDTGPGYVIINQLVHAKPSAHIGSWVFSIEMVKQHARWLVNRVYTIAVMNPPTHRTHEIGPADFASPSGASKTLNEKPKMGVAILPVLGILALILLIPLTLGGIALVRARRWRRMVQSTGSTSLPPLPSGYRPQTGEAREETRETVSQR